MNILLASLKTLPKLVNGKVIVLNNDNTYTAYNPARGVTIEDDFDPTQYSILISKKYSKCIVYSVRLERECYLVNKQIQEEFKKRLTIGIGDVIHIHSRRGIYKITDITTEYAVITCKKWENTETPIRRITIDDIKCIAGGIYNHNFV